MKVATIVICLVLLSCISSKITKQRRSGPPIERRLAMSASDMADNEDRKAINRADSRMTSLVQAVVRLKSNLHDQLETTINYLKYHFNQRDAFDKRVMMQTLAKHGVGLSVGNTERRLTDQPMLKDYGKIDNEAKKADFETVKVPQKLETAETSSSEIAKPAEAQAPTATAEIQLDLK